MVVIPVGFQLSLKCHKAQSLDHYYFLSTYVNDPHEAVVHTNLSHLATDNVASYKEVGSAYDCDLFQEDINYICSWASKWLCLCLSLSQSLFLSLRANY